MMIGRYGEVNTGFYDIDGNNDLDWTRPSFVELFFLVKDECLVYEE